MIRDYCRTGVPTPTPKGSSGALPEAGAEGQPRAIMTSETGTVTSPHTATNPPIERTRPSGAVRALACCPGLRSSLLATSSRIAAAPLFLANTPPMTIASNPQIKRNKPGAGPL